MTSPLVKRLRAIADEFYEMCGDIHVPLREAAARIEALEAALATANSALSLEIALRNEIARQVAAQRKEECTCTQLASNSFDEPPEYQTDPACPIHGRALEAAAAQPMCAQTAFLKAAPNGVTGLYEAIAHGDDIHRAWLKEALENWFAGKPVPRPRP